MPGLHHQTALALGKLFPAGVCRSAGGAVLVGYDAQRHARGKGGPVVDGGLGRRLGRGDGERRASLAVADRGQLGVAA